MELYYQSVFRFAVKLCGKLEQALELTQHTFCLALNHDYYLREAKRAKSWLFTLLFLEFLKVRRRERHASRVVAAPGPRSTKRATAPLVDAFTKVHEELRTPLLLFYAKDFSFSQVADYLGMSVEAVLTLLAKGRSELRLAIATSDNQNRATGLRPPNHTGRPRRLRPAV